MWYIYAMEYYSFIKKDKNFPFATTWVDLKGIRISEISQRKKNTIYYHLHMESRKYNKLVNKLKKKQTQI